MSACCIFVASKKLMKKIGLISDTHGYIDPSVATHFKTCDEIWHAGDFGSIAVADELKAIGIPLLGVYGNTGR